jgi:hypothetical protein
MKNIILSFSILLMYTACETGTKYEKNATVEKKVKEDHSILDLVEGSPSAKALVTKSYIEEKESKIDSSIAHKYDPENPLNGDAFVEESTYTGEKESLEKAPLEEDSFTGGDNSDDLNIKSIRVGYHDTYTRLVFDVVHNGEKAKKVGSYDVEYDAQREVASVTLKGYQRFLAKVPVFSRKSIIEEIDFDKDVENSTLQFSIKLRGSATVKAYDYKNPARLIIDIRPF